MDTDRLSQRNGREKEYTIQFGHLTTEINTGNYVTLSTFSFS